MKSSQERQDLSYFPDSESDTKFPEGHHLQTGEEGGKLFKVYGGISKLVPPLSEIVE